MKIDFTLYNEKKKIMNTQKQLTDNLGIQRYDYTEYHIIIVCKKACTLFFVKTNKR